MKLLSVAPYYYTKIGGLERYAHTINVGLVKQFGWDIVVVTSNHMNSCRIDEYIDGIRVIRLPVLFRLSNTPINPFWYFDLKKIIADEKPDLINAHTPVPFIADLAIIIANKIPCITTYHAGSMKKNSFLVDFIIRIYEKIILPRVLNKSQSIICSSDYVREEFLDKYLSKSITITPGVDANLFRNNSGVKRKSNALLFVGRLDKSSRWKGLEVIFQAIRVLKDQNIVAQCKIVGDGDDKKNLQQLVYSLGIDKDVQFLGQLKQIRLVNLYRSASILVLPSTTNAESFGTVLIEAMACETPVIGSRVGGISYVIDHGINGLLVPPGDPKALALAIKFLLDNPSKASVMGRNGRRKVIKRFKLSESVKRTHKIFYKHIS